MTKFELKAARKRLGMTQVELAEALLMSVSMIDKMERGARKIEPRTALLLDAVTGRRMRRNSLRPRSAGTLRLP